jgi:DNA-binding CsgD family transcriptional regulator
MHLPANRFKSGGTSRVPSVIAPERRGTRDFLLWLKHGWRCDMIEYGGLSSRRPSYLKREMTFGINTIQSRQVDGENVLDQRDLFSQTALSAIEKPFLWSDVCRMIESECPGTSVVMFPLRSSSGPIYSSAPLNLPPKLPTKETLAMLNSKKRVEFVSETLVDQDNKRLKNTTIQTCATLLNFGIDGWWIVRVSRLEVGYDFSPDELQTLSRLAATLEFTTATSTRILSASLEAYSHAFLQVGQPFAILDEALCIVTANKYFDSVSSTYFQNSGSSLTPISHHDAKALREALEDFVKGHQKVEAIFHNDHHPCVAVLHNLQADKYRVSGKKFIGLEIKGAVRALIPDSQLLSKLFVLTQREADVVALLSSGKSVSSIAANHAVSVGTVRVQLKAIFRKMSVAGQVELVSKVLNARF